MKFFQAKIRGIMKKLSLLVVSMALFVSMATPAFAIIEFIPAIVADGVETTNVAGNEVPRACSKLRGLDHPACNVQEIGEDVCEEAAIVCNKESTTGPDGDGYVSDADTIDYRYEETTDYCLLSSVSCFGENLWGPGGLEAYRAQQEEAAWDALEDGDLGGFLCHGLDGATGGVLGCEEDEGGGAPEFILPVEETTFTQFEGDFDAPEAEGYSDGLTQNRGIREYVLNVVNFVLGFLGLVAVIAVIYGGFIYLTAGGDEGKTEKGKNSILYAVIGIIIILAAFALVRTVICYAPVGGDDRPTFCKSGGGGVSAAGELNLTEEVGSSATSTFETAERRLEDIGASAIKISADYLNVQSASEYLSRIDYSTQGAIDEALRVLGSLRSSVDDFPQTLEDINFMIDYLNNQHPFVSEAPSLKERLLARVMPVASAATLYAADLYGLEIYTFMDYMTQDIANDSKDDYDENFEKLERYAEGLESLFGEIEDARAEMEDVTNKLAELKVTRADRDLLTELIIEINEAAETAKNLEFVQVRLNASERRCSAPCVVLFDSIGSVDPSGQTILDAQHEWDLNGDGSFNSPPSGECEETSAATVSCIYETPGTYVATLKIDSAEQNRYASGIATIVVEVTRPLSKVKVNVASSTGVEVLAIDQTVAPMIQNNRVKFTLEESRAGLLFNAVGSLGSSGNPISEYTWNFEGDQFSGANPSHTYAFTQRGTYRVVLEVTENNITERAMVFLEIGSPSSNFVILNQDNQIFQTGQAVNFDGSYSRSDNGAVTSYTWRVLKDGEIKEEFTSGASDWSFVPSEPGLYTVRLQVIDAVGESDINESTFLVESRQPQACFTYEFLDETQPGTVTFRNCSLDPDPDDDLAYFWTVENGEFIEGTTAESAEPIVKFNTEGEKIVTLTVNDQYVEETLRQEHTMTDIIDIESILDIALDIPDGPAYQLDETTGEVEVTFQVTSENAVAYEVDFGDGSKEEQSGVGTVTFTHIYDQADAYIVEATVFDEDDDANEITRRLFIGDANAPLPVLDVSIDGIALDLTSGGPVEVPRNTSITFDGSDSLNTDGTGRRLIYLINYGDGTVGSTKESTHIYEEIGIYEVNFTVTDEDTGAYGAIPLTLNVIDSPPIVHSLSSNLTSTSLETPVDIAVRADAEDVDGRITQYTWYLFDADNTSNILETQVSSGDQTVFNFHGIGTTGEEHRVGMCVKVKDDGDNETDSCVDGPYTYTMTVTGENEPPRANFSVADNTVLVGEPVIFYDESTDDNEIIEIYYDVMGNGFLDDEATTQTSISHIYERIGEYQVRVKVVDSNGASSVSAMRPVFVETSVDFPVAKIRHEVENLTVNFEDNSEIDPETELASRTWDFNTNVDSDGDGYTDNDVDSTEENPSHTYELPGMYNVRLVIKDAQGNEDDVEKTIEAESEPLEAKMRFTPSADPSDNKVHLNGESDELRVDFSGSTGPIVEYVLDGNVYYDSDGNGVSDDDRDQTFTEPREALFYYEAAWQPIVIKLTVVDAAGNSDFVTKQIVFDEPDTPLSPPVE